MEKFSKNFRISTMATISHVNGIKIDFEEQPFLL